MKTHFRFLSVIITVGALLLSAQNLSAQDFKCTLEDGNTLFFNVLDSLNKTLEVTFRAPYNRPEAMTVSGKVEIPANVALGDNLYTVVRIGAKAFSSGDKITSIVIPETVTRIREYAFESCTSLEEVVFPSSQIIIAKNAFYNCKKLKNIGFGSAWKEINLSLFESSDSLQTLNVPASVVKISPLNTIRSLENVNVDEANLSFASHDGLLYSKDTTVLYNCPVSHKGKVTVPEGVTTILNGAFRGCNMVESVDLPSTIEQLGYSEFYGMESLGELIIRSLKPVLTAIFDSKSVFTLKVPSKTILYLTKKAIKEYLKLLNCDAGLYQNMDGNNQEICSSDDLISPKRIKKIK